MNSNMQMLMCQNLIYLQLIHTHTHIPHDMKVTSLLMNFEMKAFSSCGKGA